MATASPQKCIPLLAVSLQVHRVNPWGVLLSSAERSHLSTACSRRKPAAAFRHTSSTIWFVSKPPAQVCFCMWTPAALGPAPCWHAALCTEPSVLSPQGDASPARRGPGHILHHILQQQPPGTCRCCHRPHAAAQEAANLSAQHTDVWVSRSHPAAASCPSCLGEGGSFTNFLEG